ncbi:MAG: 2-hydroxyacyl-CoA dehydratase family protein [Promethearchaeia archaeon]
MSVFADDIINFESMLKLSYNFLAGRDYLKKKKFQEKKKLVSVALPYSDLAFAAGAVPTFPIRMEKFKIDNYLKQFNTATNIFGWKNVTNFLGFIKQFDSLNIVDSVLDNVINSINEKYNELYDLGMEKGLPNDFCYGIKALWGMHISKGKNVDGILNFTIRCSAYNKYMESLKNLVPEAKQIWIDIPPRDIGNTLEIAKENINKGIQQLEELTGNNVTDNSLKKQFRIGNQIKRYYKTILFDISKSDFYPCNAASFAEILSLLSISFQDLNSNAQRYLNNIADMAREMRERINNRVGEDLSDSPRILLTPMFGGWEPKSHEFIHKVGGRVLYGDWEIFGYLEEIDTSGDPVEAYAKYLLDCSTKGIGCDNSKTTDSYLRTAKKLDVDGVIYNQVFGCHSISNNYYMLREKLRREGIPSTVINFNKIGENVEQVKTRLQAFYEILQN